MNTVFHKAFVDELAKLGKSYSVPESKAELAGIGRGSSDKFNKALDSLKGDTDVAGRYYQHRQRGNSPEDSGRKVKAHLMTPRSGKNRAVMGTSAAAQIGGLGALGFGKKRRTHKIGAGLLAGGIAARVGAHVAHKRRVGKTEKALKTNPTLGKGISFKRSKLS